MWDMPKRPKPQSRKNVGPGKQYPDYDAFNKDEQAWYDEAAKIKKERQKKEQAQIALDQKKREGKALPGECAMGGQCNHVMHGDDGSGHPTHTKCSKCGSMHRA